MIFTLRCAGCLALYWILVFLVHFIAGFLNNEPDIASMSLLAACFALLFKEDKE